MAPGKTVPLPHAAGGTAVAATKGPAKPKAGTFVSVGDLRAQMAFDASLSQADREVHLAGARESYQKALDLEPKNLAAQLGMARSYGLGGDSARAKAEFEKLLTAHPAHAGLWAEYAMCLSRLKEWDGSARCWQKAMELEPGNKGYAKAGGLTLARAGRYDEAFAWLTQAVPTDEAHYLLGRMLYQLRQDGLAAQQMARAVQLNPANVDAREMLAQWRDSAPAILPASATIPAAPAAAAAPSPIVPAIALEPVPVSRASSHLRTVDDWAVTARTPPIVTSNWEMIPPLRPITVRAASPEEPMPIRLGFVEAN
jgi:tetratricopeptide (TPR) repeat protein